MNDKHKDYPNKRDYDPQRGDRNEGELPLADPSDSDHTHEFRENAKDKTGQNDESAFGNTEDKILEEEEQQARRPEKPSDPGYNAHSPNEEFPGKP
ncbi:hypothetical protein ACFFIY_02325 [Bhargavaea ullalensis]|uniref:Uncharacterized protein n=1 Tax=Bhargavaea ullalensis TaxID=1265685 RepID=A0ABV2GB79_9BACL